MTDPNSKQFSVRNLGNCALGSSEKPFGWVGNQLDWPNSQGYKMDGLIKSSSRFTSTICAKKSKE